MLRDVGFLPWKLQHRGNLTGDQPRQLDDGPVREFERVVMRARIVEFDLPEASEVAAR